MVLKTITRTYLVYCEKWKLKKIFFKLSYVFILVIPSSMSITHILPNINIPFFYEQTFAHLVSSKWDTEEASIEKLGKSIMLGSC